MPRTRPLRNEGHAAACCIHQRRHIYSTVQERERQQQSRRGPATVGWTVLALSGLVLLLTDSTLLRRHPEYDISSARTLTTIDSLLYHLTEGVTASDSAQEGAITPQGAITPRAGRERRQFCKNVTDFFDIEEVEVAIEQSVSFHTLLGAVKSVSTLCWMQILMQRSRS